jgi:hypothetical protein
LDTRRHNLLPIDALDIDFDFDFES